MKGLRLWAVAVWLLVWQLASMVLAAAYPHGGLLLASPVAAFVRLGQLAMTAAFWLTVGRSTARIFGGFLLGCAAAVALAVPASRFRPLRELLSPLVAAVKAVPVVSFIILALVWLKGQSLSCFIAALMAFPPVYLNLLCGIDTVDSKLLELCRVYRVPLRRQVKGVYLPHLRPFLRSSCSLALGLCWKAGVAAEVIGLPEGTVGERLYTAKVYFQTPDLFAWTAVIVALSALIERLLLFVIDRWEVRA